MIRVGAEKKLLASLGVVSTVDEQTDLVPFSILVVAPGDLSLLRNIPSFFRIPGDLGVIAGDECAPERC